MKGRANAASARHCSVISLIESRLTYLSPKEAKSRAHAILAAMVGSVVLSRIVMSPKLSDSLLRDTRGIHTPDLDPVMGELVLEACAWHLKGSRIPQK